MNNVKKALRGACRRANITGLNFHDLGRECGSRWLEGGVGLLTISALLGHTQVTTTNTYLASSPPVAEDEFASVRGGPGERFPKPFPNCPTRPLGPNPCCECASCSGKAKVVAAVSNRPPIPSKKRLGPSGRHRHVD